MPAGQGDILRRRGRAVPAALFRFRNPMLKLTLGSETVDSRTGNGSDPLGMSDALTKCSWNLGSIAVSTL